jgi:hypothetical protein
MTLPPKPASNYTITNVIHMLSNDNTPYESILHDESDIQLEYESISTPAPILRDT